MLQYQKICLNMLSAHKIDTSYSAVTVLLQSPPYILRAPSAASFGKKEKHSQAKKIEYICRAVRQSNV